VFEEFGPYHCLLSPLIFPGSATQHLLEALVEFGVSVHSLRHLPSAKTTFYFFSEKNRAIGCFSHQHCLDKTHPPPPLGKRRAFFPFFFYFRTCHYSLRRRAPLTSFPEVASADDLRRSGRPLNSLFNGSSSPFW